MFAAAVGCGGQRISAIVPLGRLLLLLRTTYNMCIVRTHTHTHTHVHTGTLDGRREGEEEKRFSVAAAFRALFFGAAMRELLL